MNTLRSIRSICVLFLMALPGAALASQPGAQSVPEEVCFRGGPLQRCQGFSLTELAAYIGPTSSYRRPPMNFIWELGYMHNLAVHDLAVGGTLFL